MTKYYTWGPDGQLLSLTTGDSTYYAVHNGHGDITTALTNKSGNTVASYAYDAWGNILSSTGTAADLNPYRYGNYRYDSVSGLYDLNMRYYDPSIERFLSEDPTTEAPDYIYADNNPLTYLDPDGTWLLNVAFLVSDAISFAANPTWGAAAWVELDIVSTALPVGSLSAVAHGIEYVAKATRIVKKGKNAIRGTEEALDLGRSVGDTSGHVENVVTKGTSKYDNGWDMPKGSSNIGGRKYSEHALERMAPDNIQVRAELEKRAVNKGLKPGTKEFKNYIQPRGVPPMVVEDTIRSVKPIAGNRPNTVFFRGNDVNVITNTNWDVITVILNIKSESKTGFSLL